ncbi:sigma-70 family RNA polymerase sigma factor [Streptomyces olivaceus]|uniref:sigma-70 family RNA polymerase sigma factor n=1 Tax=Streptomyces olivaceus TaxID=47716 RepID=UPI001CCA1DE5|nr:sigma-70 family RNA polymerase sigma factor [Streptomyces olivaceus]MBZ6175141.1 sigma-70 family RNA polymerase sigma factor [Streptomyces olivaceus]MBZ6181583.1 sigma-70 family RNA polymerase sigma factor [Streptomyces olivaceus]
MSWSVIGSKGAVSDRDRAMRVICDELAGPLHSYVLRLLQGDHHRTEDVVQETLLRCWRTQDPSDGGSLRPWLFRVARNLVIDDYRRTARRREAARACSFDAVPTQSDGLDRMLDSVVLKEAFRSLSRKHREVIYEYYYSDRSTREAAVVLGIPPGTVKSRAHHALRALRKALCAVGNDRVSREGGTSSAPATGLAPAAPPQSPSAEPAVQATAADVVPVVDRTVPRRRIAGQSADVRVGHRALARHRNPTGLPVSCGRVTGTATHGCGVVPVRCVGPVRRGRQTHRCGKSATFHPAPPQILGPRNECAGCTDPAARSDDDGLRHGRIEIPKENGMTEINEVNTYEHVGPPSSAALLPILGGFQVSQAAYVVAKLGVATILEQEGPTTLATLAERTGARPEPLARLVRSLAPLGLFSTDGDTVTATAVGALLSEKHPESLYNAALMWMETHYLPFSELLHSVTTGKPGADKYLGEPFFDYLNSDPGRSALFSRAMGDVSAGLRTGIFDGYRLPAGRTVADIGAADGSVLSELLKRDADPQRQGIVFDLPTTVVKRRTGSCGGRTHRTGGVRGRRFLRRRSVSRHLRLEPHPPRLG